MIKKLFITGYRPQELGIFSDNHPGIAVIKQALENKLRLLIDEGLEWVLISGQQGTETWAAEITLQLKKEFPHIKLAIIAPFLEQHARWKEPKQQHYLSLLAQADFHSQITNKPYEAPWQFIEKDKFMVTHSDGLLLVYDEEQEASPKYIKRLAERFAETNTYTIMPITAFDLQEIAEELQRSEWD